MTNEELDAIKAALKKHGNPEYSVYLLTHENEPRAKCPPFDVWFAIKEIEQAGRCPKCGQRGDFEVPDEYTPTQTA